ncbi:MAG: hypothetical protein WAP74_03455 [Patescibacteria group bacterium]
MNTLQQRFPKVYQDFFSQCTKVASAPHSFFWFGDLTGLWGGKTIIQKLPMRFYVGLQPINKNRFEVDPEFTAYSRMSDQFETVRFDEFVVKRLSTYGVANLRGWRLRFFSEVSIGVSLGAVGALAACVASLKQLTLRVGEPRTLRVRYSDKLFHEAWEIARLLQDNKSSGASAYAALTESAYPIVFSSTWPTFSAKPIGPGSAPSDDPVWPIDFALVFSGKIVKGEAVVRSIESARDQLVNGGWQTYLNMLDLVSAEGAKALGQLLKKGTSEAAIERLFDLMNQYQNLLHFVNLSTPQLDMIYGSVHRIANKSANQVGSGAKITGLGKGGEMLVALPYGEHRKELEAWTNEAGYSLDYASWRDGFSSEGVVVEQDIEAGKRSGFLKGDLVKVHTWQEHHHQTSLEEYTKVKPKSFDLLLDQITNRVYIKGKPVDSTKLPSQKAVVTIVGKLLQTDTWQLANSEIPLPTYAQSRYDLHGKVVIPFVKALKVSAADFSLKLSGGLYDDYTLKLEANRLKICLVMRF